MCFATPSDLCDSGYASRSGAFDLGRVRVNECSLAASVLTITERYRYLDRFPREIHDALGWYVYRLIDPRTGHTFYVGKGRGDRLFEHVKGALNEEETEDESLIDLK